MSTVNNEIENKALTGIQPMIAAVVLFILVHVAITTINMYFVSEEICLCDYDCCSFEWAGVNSRSSITEWWMLNSSCNIFL
jgi:hypothetical protein